MADGNVSDDNVLDSGIYFGSDWTPYSKRPDWADVTPIKQADGADAVVKIAYSDKFREIFDYFRAVLKSNEMSKRAFELTTDAIEVNSANYTVWHFRQKIIRHMAKDMYTELNFVSQVIEDHPKNYQVWHHRHIIVEWLNDASQELSFTASILESDSKNYHAWQHRQWVLGKFNLWDNELFYINELLEEDVRNNSAWNQRYFVISHTSGFTNEIISGEIKYVLAKIDIAPNNESSWNYLSGILAGKDYSSFRDVICYCAKKYADNIRSPFLLAFMMDIECDHLERKTGNQQEHIDRVSELCAELAEKYDTVRSQYWLYFQRSISLKYENITF